ncbi:MAG: ATP-binding protein [Gammaproteobacteria bacterium]|nr:ATP-binding protein [Gammaproteobacteria bacterium]
MAIEPLTPDELRPGCDPDSLDFDTTAQADESTGILGQDRAVEALTFGMGMRSEGYNLFALGPSGVGKLSLIRQYAAQQAVQEPVPAEWCYVNNFDDYRKPRALQLPAGRGTALAADMSQLVNELGRALPALFESEEYRTRSESIEEGLNEQQQKAMRELQEKAQAKNIVLVRTPAGVTLAPMRNGETLGPEEFEKLPEEEQKKIQEDIEALQEEMRRMFRQAPAWQKESRAKLDELNREMVAGVVSQSLEPIRERYGDLANASEYLDRVERDVVTNFDHLLPGQKHQVQILGAQSHSDGEEMPWTNRYRVNVLTPRETNHGAPVVFEDHPTYNNLLGRIEHRAQQGALFTDFTMIRSGTLHRANGGYLLVDALQVLTQPFAWDALKRVLKAGRLQLEPLGESLSLISTASLEPESIPLQVKVVLMGEPMIYYLLSTYDAEFADLFKVQVDFNDRMDRDGDSQKQYAGLIASLVRRHDLPAFDRRAVARVIEFSARLADDNEKLSTHMRAVTDLLHESAYWAGRRQGSGRVSGEDVQQAIDNKIRRSDRVRERIQEEIRRGTILIDTDSEHIGQINGLSVIGLGGFSFGRPSRITARTRIGKGQVVDIEREVEMGGPLHSKGVLILSHFLGARYALHQPLSLSASLVFEQSYGGVDGDSASSAELYALLSDLAEAPLRQTLAVTGSVNQHGEIQAIGGVNEKIEGFFDCCRARGLTGRQGVLIPQTNVKHLMLRQDVVDAVEAGEFAVYPVTTVDEGIELLTGITAGARDAEGRFPADSINGRVEARLIDYSERMRAFSAGPNSKGQE